ncbi:MAG: Ger(x)C family spore germination protein [Syntrophomonadaceae bacterium]|jgi:spore germination protein KC|nr:Ger(x)C family spore germination protein [Syntrophomonadaceae bacterium]
MLGSCYDLHEINDAAIAQNFSLDLLENGQVAFLAQTTQPVPRSETGETQPSQNISVMGTGRTAAEAARGMFLHFSRLFLWIHANTLFIGENLARQDLTLISDFLMRNRNLRFQTCVYLVCGVSIQDIHKAMNERGFAITSARGITQQIETQAEELGYYTPLANIELLERMLTPGIEPALPQLTVIKEGDKDRIVLQGMGVIKNNRLIGKLNPEQSQGYYYLQSKKKQGGLISIAWSDSPNAMAVMHCTQFTSNTRPFIQEGKLNMKIDIKCELQYLETIGDDNIYVPANQQRLEYLAEEKIKQQVRSCIIQAQQLNSDILGWGLTTARYQPGWWEDMAAQWDQVFPVVGSQVEVECILCSDGLSRESFRFN